MSLSCASRAVAALLGIGSLGSVHAATFDVANGQTLTTAQTLAASQTGTVESGGTLSINKGTVAITVTGSSTIVNSGTITQTGTGRAIRDNTGGLTLTVTNDVGALIQTADADVIQMNVGTSTVTFNNAGTLNSKNASAGGSQAIDFNAIATGSNILNNAATGLIEATEADAVRPGVNGFVNNDGTIKSTSTTGSSSDGVDLQTNSGGTIVNATTGSETLTGTGTIEGARHGITGGADTADTSASGGVFVLAVTNNRGGIIQGDNGSGINIDGFNSNEVVTIVNHGTITGNGISADGDGVDVDGLVNLTNTGTILSTQALNDTSEGVTVGGGSITNSGTIEGDNINGGIGRGITLAGIDKDPLTDAPIVPPQGIYGPTSVTNSGLIRGQTDSAIAVTGAASPYLITITNQAGATLRGGGATAATIATGANTANVINSGAIIADSSNLAIDLGSGNDSLQILGGSASIQGNISGGSGSSTLSIDPGAGNSFSYAGQISQFASAQILSGSVVLGGASTYAGATSVAGGGLQLDGSLVSPITVAGSAALRGTGTASGTVDILGAIRPGDVPGDVATLRVGALNLHPGSVSTFDLGSAGNSDSIQSSGAVNIGSGAAMTIGLPSTPAAGDYLLINGASITGTFSAPTFSPALPSSLQATLVYGATSVTLRLQAVSGLALATSANPAVFGQPVTFTAALSGDAPTGTVNFFDGTTLLGSATVSGGTAIFSTPALGVGSHSINASYSGDATHTAVSAALTAAEVVNMAATTTQIAAPATSGFGQTVSVTASVAVVAPGAGTPTGSIVIGDGGGESGDACTITLPATSCSLTPSSAGSKALSATYSGDANFSTSTGTASLGVGVVASSLTVTSSANPSAANQPVTITAIVTAAMQTGVTAAPHGKALAAAVPGGNVSFSLDGGAAVNVPLVSAQASYTTPALTAGSHTITVNYSGDSNTAPSSFSLSQVVNAAAPPSGVAAPAPALSGAMLCLLAVLCTVTAAWAQRRAVP